MSEEGSELSTLIRELNTAARAQITILTLLRKSGEKKKESGQKTGPSDYEDTCQLRFTGGGFVIFKEETEAEEFVRNIEAALSPLIKSLKDEILKLCNHSAESYSIKNIEKMMELTQWIDKASEQFYTTTVMSPEIDGCTGVRVEFIERWVLYFPRTITEEAESTMHSIQRIINKAADPYKKELLAAIKAIASVD